MTAATLHHFSAGRFDLGLGASTRALAEGFHDVPFTRVAARLRSTVTSVRALLAGEPPKLTGVPSAHAIRLAVPPCPDLPIWLAALSDRTLQVVGELADGWLPFFVTREQLCALSGQSELGAHRGRSDGSRIHRRRRARSQLPMTILRWRARLAAGMVAGTPAPWATCTVGFSRSTAMRTKWARFVPPTSVRSSAAAWCPDEAQNVLKGLAAYGSAREVREQLECWDEAVDIVTLDLSARTGVAGIGTHAAGGRALIPSSSGSSCIPGIPSPRSSWPLTVSGWAGLGVQPAPRFPWFPVRASGVSQAAPPASTRRRS